MVVPGGPVTHVRTPRKKPALHRSIVPAQLAPVRPARGSTRPGSPEGIRPATGVPSANETIRPTPETPRKSTPARRPAITPLPPCQRATRADSGVARGRPAFFGPSVPPGPCSWGPPTPPNPRRQWAPPASHPTASSAKRQEVAGNNGARGTTRRNRTITQGDPSPVTVARHRGTSDRPLAGPIEIRGIRAMSAEPPPPALSQPDAWSAARRGSGVVRGITSPILGHRPCGQDGRAVHRPPLLRSAPPDAGIIRSDDPHKNSAPAFLGRGPVGDRLFLNRVSPAHWPARIRPSQPNPVGGPGLPIAAPRGPGR